EEAKKKAQLQNDKALNTKPSVQQSARLLNTTNGTKLKPRNFNKQPRNWPPSRSSRVSNRTDNITEPPRNQKSFLKTKDLGRLTCKQWKPTGRIFKTVGLRWVPTGKIFTSSTNKVDSEPLNGSNEDITNHNECEQTLDVSECTLNLRAGFKEFSTDAQAMTSDHNSSELRIHDHINEQSSSKLVPKVVPSANKTATSRQELELLFHHHITMLSAGTLNLNAGTSFNPKKEALRVWLLKKLISQKPRLQGILI
nr:hypothetical protein [Tanacetum cinerariifolium]